MKNNVGYQLQTTVQMDRQRRGVDACLLLCREGVELAAYTIDAVQNMPGTTMLCALEDRMLYEVSHSFIMTLFIARAHINK